MAIPFERWSKVLSFDSSAKSWDFIAEELEEQYSCDKLHYFNLTIKYSQFSPTWTSLVEGGKGYFRHSWSALFFCVKCEMANFFLVNRDFHRSHEAWFCKIIFHETRNKCLIRHEPWFSLCLCYFRQPLLRNKWYYVTVIPVATTWLVWFSVTFGQPSFSSSVSSISTIMAEAHQHDVRDDQDRQQGKQACMVLPNVTVLIPG